MFTPFVYLCLQTLILWFLVIFLHRKKNRFTLIPLYAYIAILTLLTHNLSDLNFAVVVNQWYLLISSFSFFTSLMLGILFLYLFEGPRATRLALITVLCTSFFYIGVVFFLSLQTDTSKWVVLSFEHLKYYFFSISAIIINIFFIPISWELLGKIKIFPFTRIFFVIFSTLLLDSFIFVTGVFGSQQIYVSVLQANLIIRLVLALIMTPIISFYLQREGYTEEGRDKPKVFWEILNFKSDLESKIQSLEEAMGQEDKLKRELEESHETYQLAVEGVSAGIWDWDILHDRIMFSKKFRSLLGFEPEIFLSSIEEFKKIIHPEDIERTFLELEKSNKKKEPYSIEYRLLTKNGTYKWYLCGGISKYGSDGKPMRMVGSIIDINEKKLISEEYKQKIQELENSNKIMIDRELKMVELKKEIEQLRKKTN